MPPSKGLCHAVFLLVHVASLGRSASKRDWIEAAKARPVIAAQSYDLNGIAERLIDWGLIEASSSIVISHPLCRLSSRADYPTLRSIAEILLRKRPPVWLRFAVVDGVLRKELIPTVDLDALSWLGEDLELVLLSVFKYISRNSDDGLAAALGRAGELVVINALENAGRFPRHVSLISDAFGYDIECFQSPILEGIEVKTSVTKTASRFHLSRNEFEVSKRLRDRWKIIQVVFSSKVIATGRVEENDIEIIRELPAEVIHDIAPSEREFQWTESAIFMPDENSWLESKLLVRKQFALDLNVEL